MQILGWGAGGVVPVPVNDRYRMRPDKLAEALASARAAGRRVIAVVATAGSVPTGDSIRFPPIADFCAAHDLWLHVDGAHGASASLSAQHRHLVAGIERADSVVWDAHKMMLMPSLVTMVLFRDEASSYRTFDQDATYLFHDDHPAWSDTCLRTMECTKNNMSVKLYAALACLGPQLLADYIDRMFALGARFGEMIAANYDFELALTPSCNIVMFRYRPAGVADLDALQDRIRSRICHDGQFFIVQATLGQRVYLRTTLMNPLSREEDLAALLDAIRHQAAA